MTETKEKPKLAGLGTAISEAIAIRELLFSREEAKQKLDAQISDNDKTIAGIERLKEVNATLRENRNALANEIAGYKAELDKRVKKLSDAGISMPLNDEQKVKGFSSVFTNM
jgi:uncharacterized coiled-coil DUF342 family protein